MHASSDDALVRRDHLVNRDNWDSENIPPEHIHLMVRCMEAWIVSDPEELAKLLPDRAFHANALPTRANLEDEPKNVAI